MPSLNTCLLHSGLSQGLKTFLTVVTQTLYIVGIYPLPWLALHLQKLPPCFPGCKLKFKQFCPSCNQHFPDIPGCPQGTLASLMSFYPQFFPLPASQLPTATTELSMLGSLDIFTTNVWQQGNRALSRDLHLYTLHEKFSFQL